jgi:hypothetical protein
MEIASRNQMNKNNKDSNINKSNDRLTTRSTDSNSLSPFKESNNDSERKVQSNYYDQCE